MAVASNDIEGVHRVLLCEAIGRPLVRACHRGIREFCLSRGARVFMRQARRRSCSPCCRPALREPGCRTLLQIARAVVDLDRTGMPSCPGAANEASPPRPPFPKAPSRPTPWTNRSPVPPPWTGGESSRRSVRAIGVPWREGFHFYLYGGRRDLRCCPPRRSADLSFACRAARVY